jgi:hypothetical protein
MTRRPVAGHNTKKYYPEKLLRIGYLDSKNNKMLMFLTNNFALRQ